jgi:hypothetical protein
MRKLNQFESLSSPHLHSTSDLKVDAGDPNKAIDHQYFRTLTF